MCTPNPSGELFYSHMRIEDREKIAEACELYKTQVKYGGLRGNGDGEGVLFLRSSSLRQLRWKG